MLSKVRIKNLIPPTQSTIHPSQISSPYPSGIKVEDNFLEISFTMAQIDVLDSSPRHNTHVASETRTQQCPESLDTISMFSLNAVAMEIYSNKFVSPSLESYSHDKFWFAFQLASVGSVDSQVRPNSPKIILSFSFTSR